MKKIHILTLNWNGAEKLSRLYPSLKENLNNFDYHWWIKDNASEDKSMEVIQSWNDERVHAIKYPHNRDSYSYGMNFLFKESGAQNDDLVLSLNNDIQFIDNKSISNMAKILNDKEVGQVGAKLNYFNSNKIQHVGVLFSLKHRGLPFHYRQHMNEESRDKEDRLFPAITGAVALTRADIFKSCWNNKSGLGGFDEGYTFGFEDIDMSLMINLVLKKKVVCAGNVGICHEESASLKKNPVHKLHFVNNAKLLLSKWINGIDYELYKKYENPKFAIYR